MKIKNVMIATFAYRREGERTALNGMIEPLLYYFAPRTNNIYLIEGTHPGSDTVFTYFERYKKNKLLKRHTSTLSILMSPLLNLFNNNSTQIIFKLRDILTTVEYGLLVRKKVDLFIGLESIYTIAGLFLKKIGKVEKVIYYVSDYTPNRYGNKVFNSIYLWLDQYCCKNADAVWDVSAAMLPARESVGFDKKLIKHHKLVPNALFPQQISYLSMEETEPYSLVFAGTFGPENGPKLAVEAVHAALKKLPKLRLHLMGGGDKYEEELKRIVKKLKIEKNVIFHGFINNAIEVSKITKQAMVGIAPYVNIPNSPRLYADATKIRLYLGAGLPVITTTVPPLAKDTKIKKAVIAVNDNKKELADAIVNVFKNKSEYERMRKAAISYAKQNTWENTYDNALSNLS